MSFVKVVKSGLMVTGAVTAALVGLPYLAKGLGRIAGYCDERAAELEAELREKKAAMGVDCGDILGHDDAAGDDACDMKESVGRDGDADPCVDNARVSDDEDPCYDGADDEEAEDEEVEDIFDRVRNIVESMPDPGEIIVVIAK